MRRGAQANFDHRERRSVAARRCRVRRAGTDNCGAAARGRLHAGSARRALRQAGQSGGDRCAQPNGIDAPGADGVLLDERVSCRRSVGSPSSCGRPLRATRAQSGTAVHAPVGVDPQVARQAGHLHALEVASGAGDRHRKLAGVIAERIQARLPIGIDACRGGDAVAHRRGRATVGHEPGHGRDDQAVEVLVGRAAVGRVGIDSSSRPARRRRTGTAAVAAAGALAAACAGAKMKSISARLRGSNSSFWPSTFCSRSQPPDAEVSAEYGADRSGVIVFGRVVHGLRDQRAAARLQFLREGREHARAPIAVGVSATPRFWPDGQHAARDFSAPRLRARARYWSMPFGADAAGAEEIERQHRHARPRARRHIDFLACQRTDDEIIAIGLRLPQSLVDGQHAGVVHLHGGPRIGRQLLPALIETVRGSWRRSRRPGRSAAAAARACAGASPPGAARPAPAPAISCGRMDWDSVERQRAASIAPLSDAPPP